jgi:hypothetical protein
LPLIPYADPAQGAFGVGNAFQETILVPNPAAGSGFTITTPGQYHSFLIVAFFRLVATAVVNSRVPVIELRDSGGNVVAAGAFVGAQTANTTWEYCYAPDYIGSASGSQSSLNMGVLPKIWLPPSWQVNMRVNAIDAGDQLQRIRLTFIRAWTKEPYAAPRRRPRRRNPLG